MEYEFFMLLSFTFTWFSLYFQPATDYFRQIVSSGVSGSVQKAGDRSSLRFILQREYYLFSGISLLILHFFLWLSSTLSDCINYYHVFRFLISIFVYYTDLLVRDPFTGGWIRFVNCSSLLPTNCSKE